jgi:trans-2,3-dihydro-3-hydroxyanthranilate isomerase
MQKIAAEFNLSETVFVLAGNSLASSNYQRRLRIFTPKTEIPFAGHPTVGAAYVLAKIGRIPLIGEKTTIVFEEGVGNVGVTINVKDGQIVSSFLTAAQLPEFGPEPPALETLAAMLSLESSALLNNTDYPEAISCGIPFLFIPLKNRQVLAAAKIDQDLWQKALSNYWAPQVYVFTYETELPTSQLRARMFAPALGINEDPATGSAATALAGYLNKRERHDRRTLKWRVEQGFEMGRPSFIEIEVDRENNLLQEIRVGGSSVLVSAGSLNLNND